MLGKITSILLHYYKSLITVSITQVLKAVTSTQTELSLLYKNTSETLMKTEKPSIPSFIYIFRCSCIQSTKHTHLILHTQKQSHFVFRDKTQQNQNTRIQHNCTFCGTFLQHVTFLNSWLTLALTNFFSCNEVGGAERSMGE